MNDLLFGARIRSAAEQAGATIRFARTPAQLRESAARARLILLDLETRWLNAPELIAELKQDASTRAVPIVAFGSHVQAAVLEGARRAGADRVVARSAFVKMLPDLMRE